MVSAPVPELARLWKSTGGLLPIKSIPLSTGGLLPIKSLRLSTGGLLPIKSIPDVSIFTEHSPAGWNGKVGNGWLLLLVCLKI